MENADEFQSLRIAGLIRKYREGDLNESEEIELNQWIAESPHNQLLFTELSGEQYIGQQIDHIKSYDADKAFERISGRIDVSERKPAVVRHLFLKIVAIAASILSLTVLYLNQSTISGWLHPVHFERQATLVGQRKILTLADGTKIWLSPASSLDYPDRFNGKTREIKLSGEAFLEVAKDHKHPFIIHADKVTTTVLGTSFDLKAYPEEKNITVTLLTGKVSFASGNKKVFILPNQQAIFEKDGGNITKRNYPDAKNMLARRDGNMEYDGVSVFEIIADLQRDYNMNIAIEGGVANCKFYGHIKDGEDPVKFLRKLCVAVGASLRLENDYYIISGEGCE